MWPEERELKGRLIALFALTALLSGCVPPPSSVVATPNVQATVNAAVSATVAATQIETSTTGGLDASPTSLSDTPTPTPQPNLFGFESSASSAEHISYDSLFRNNEQYVEHIVYFTGQVVQVLSAGGDKYQLRVNVTNTGFFWDDTVFVHYKGTRLLEDDVVEFVATVNGLYTYKAVLGNEITIPELTALKLRLANSGSSTAAISSTPAPTSTPEPGLSRANPVEISVPIVIESDAFTLEVTVLHIVRGPDAWQMLRQAYSYNDQAAPGFEFLLAIARVRVVDASNADDSFNVNSYDADAVSGTGSVYLAGTFVIPPSPKFSGELFEGGSLSGWIAFEVETIDEKPLMRFSPFYDGPNAWIQLYKT